MDESFKKADDKLNKEARTFLPEILAPGTGLSPLTPKSIVPTNNVTTIQDILDGKKYKLPGGGGDWSSGWGEDVSKSYKEDGDMYKRRERDLDILGKMLTPSMREPEKWKIRIPGGWEIKDSFELATKRKRELMNKGVKSVWVSRVAQNNTNVEIASEALAKTFMVESFDIYKNTKEVGSAFCIGENIFATCAHVVKKYNKNTDQDLTSKSVSGMNKLFLVQNGRKYQAEVIGFNPILDIAILKSNINCDFFELELQTNIGEEILAVGSPHGFENNVTFGTIGSLDKTIYSYQDAPKYMFVDLSALPGNSGGPIIKVGNGKVVGILTAIVSSKGDYGLNAGLPSSYLYGYCKTLGIL